MACPQFNKMSKLHPEDNSMYRSFSVLNSVQGNAADCIKYTVIFHTTKQTGETVNHEDLLSPAFSLMVPSLRISLS